MKLTTLVAACIIRYASAHYFFDTLIIDGTETKPLHYVRENTRQAKYNPTKWKNTRDDMTPDMDDFRCNKGAFESASRTSTAEVKAGAKLGMKLAVGATMQHPGPALVYMSKAPTTAQDYEGDGDWFKIFEEGTCNPSGDFGKDAWCTWDKDNVSFTIPAGTPDGEYLIRAEHIGVHGAHDGQAEFYYSSVLSRQFFTETFSNTRQLRSSQGRRWHRHHTAHRHYQVSRRLQEGRSIVQLQHLWWLQRVPDARPGSMGWCQHWWLCSFEFYQRASRA